MKTEVLKLKGKVVKILSNAQYNVQAENITNPLLCYLSGKMSQNHIKPTLEDKVEIEISPTDLKRGRIIRLFK